MYCGPEKLAALQLDFPRAKKFDLLRFLLRFAQFFFFVLLIKATDLPEHVFMLLIA